MGDRHVENAGSHYAGDCHDCQDNDGVRVGHDRHGHRERGHGMRMILLLRLQSCAWPQYHDVGRRDDDPAVDTRGAVHHDDDGPAD